MPDNSNKLANLDILFGVQISLDRCEHLASNGVSVLV